MLKELLALFPILVSVSTIQPSYFSSNGNSDRAVSFGDSLVDGSVYYIRCANDTSKAITIPNSNYSNGQVLQITQFNSLMNQRFILKKESTYNGQTTYSLSPVEDDLKVLRNNGNNNNENKALELQSESNHVSNVNSNKFRIISGVFSNSYRLLTGASEFNKYLTTNNYSLASGTTVVQKSYDSSYYSYYDWYLVKSASLGVNEKREIQINGTNELLFDIKVPVQGNYCIKTSKVSLDLDTKIALYSSGGSLLASDDDGGIGNFSALWYSFNPNENYVLKVTGYNNNQIGAANLSFYPITTVYLNTYYSSGDIDTRKDSVSPINSLRGICCYTKHIVNANKSYMLGTDINNEKRFNNLYYMLSSHGSSGGVAWLSPSDTIDKNDLSDMSNVTLAVWAICYGGKAGNIAESCAYDYDAWYSLGWPGLTYVDTSKTFTDKLWKEVALGRTIPQSVSNALSHTKSTYWYKNIFGWGDDTIISPQLYNSSSKGTANNVKNKWSDDDFYLKEAFSSLDTVNEQYLFDFCNNHCIKNYSIGDFDFFIETIDGLLSNNFFAIDKSSNTIYKHINKTSENIDETSITYQNSFFDKTILLNKKIIIDQEMALIFGGKKHVVKRIQYADDSAKYGQLFETYYDANTNQILSEEYVANLFL